MPGEGEGRPERSRPIRQVGRDVHRRTQSFARTRDHSPTDADLRTVHARAAKSASTYLHDPQANAYTKLPDTDLPPVDPNFKMAWDPNLEVALFVTGDWRATVTVWALRARK